jgi:hypothetical protein
MKYWNQIHVRYTLGMVALVMSLSSCKKLIAIQPNAPGQLITSQVFLDSSSAVAAITGIYSNLGIGSTSYNYIYDFPSGGITLFTGLTGDELKYAQTYDQDLAGFNSNTILAANNDLKTFWQGAYSSTRIYQINACIENLTAATNLTATLKAQLLGEVKMLRAFFYFNLVNLFGPVPLVIGTDYVTNARLPRSDTAAVYQQIMNDLADAENLLLPAYPSAGRLRPNLYTAIALQARVNLYRSQWAAAEAAATQIMNTGIYQLSGLDSVFLEGSNEAIWQVGSPVGPTSSDGYANSTTEGLLFGVDTALHYEPTFLISDVLRSAFTINDQRLTNWINYAVVGSDTFYFPSKYKVMAYSLSLPREDYMVFRLGEQLLIRAEARAEQNNIGGALADLNMIRERAGLADTLTTTQAGTLAVIMHERQLELFCEWGHRWYDLKRTGTINALLGAEKPGWIATDALYPLPLNELQLDPNLTQNEGY